MSGERVGWVVVEYNQASGQPDLEFPVIHDSREGADVDAEDQRARTEQRGRRETYAVAEVVLVEEPR